ncbi:MAG TPA: cyclodeaminase/cyclohydrolase family protein [Bryobacteraceae bacterium]|nr:cyclodeaminase/cyclohydrolase family protein [Bryobacteraceae bacterium]
MDPQPSVWRSSLEEFSRQLAEGDGITGAVAVAAISAAFAVSVLRMVLAVTTRKRGSESQLIPLQVAAKTLSHDLCAAADEDRAAYAAYRQASRLPRTTEHERAERDRTMRASLEKATETPLRAAQSALGAIMLCSQAAPLVRGAVAADIGGAAEILHGALRAILNSVDANLRAIGDEKLRAERQELEERATRYLGEVRDRLRTQTH